MIRTAILLVILVQLACPVASAGGGNPFHATPVPDHTVRKAPPHSSLLTKIALYQQALKQKMAGLIRQATTGESITPFIAILFIALGYGAIHAAGPGHGKAVAMSYMMSRTPSILTGLRLGCGIAFFHGLSGAICVLILHYILQTSVSGPLQTVTHVTQVVSFGLITLLGMGIVIRQGWSLFSKARSQAAPSDTKKESRGLLPWALAVGLIPCPGVVMVMLFCLSMDALALGLLLTLCICLGMAATISLFIIAVTTGKGGILRVTTKKQAVVTERILGFLSGIMIFSFGTLFLLATIPAL